MKLRLGVPNKDLAYRFGITPGRVSQVFHEWIDIMSRELRSLIVWPDREIIRKPSVLNQLMPKLLVLLIARRYLLSELHLCQLDVRPTPIINIIIQQNFL